ncbi:hypothetical protein [Lachnoanaerobaculum gingivalis]|uniref:hypothetical protein n=1 Tax=Lachnoanaerobaculum gingivalis TaxID=2490855 RepID=UPI0028D4D19D|nr:hypothetical protein [Lachnoanaerobaculum gingivalis]
MNKEDSLEFLNGCLRELDSASHEDIGRYKNAYKKSCPVNLSGSGFEFCVPKPYSADCFTQEIIYKEYIEKSKEPIKEKKCNIAGNGLECNIVDNGLVCAA